MRDVRPWKPGDRECPNCLQATPCTCCDLWTGPVDEWGYGLSGQRLPSGSHIRAHRVAYESVHGPVATGLVVLHICDQPACCFVPHLRAGTHSENMRDAYAKGRMVPPGLFRRLGDDEPCVRGHVNDFYRGSNGKRNCRTCRKELRMARRAARRRS